jgi:threonine synthase
MLAVQAVLRSEGVAVTLDDDRILQAIVAAARRWGVFGEPAGAAALAAFFALRSTATIGRDERVVVLNTGSGLKDSGAALAYTDEPIVLPAGALSAEHLTKLAST